MAHVLCYIDSIFLGHALAWCSNRSDGSTCMLFVIPFVESICSNLSLFVKNTCLWADTNQPAQLQRLDEPRCEKTDLRGFRPGPTLTGLYNRIRWLEA